MTRLPLTHRLMVGILVSLTMPSLLSSPTTTSPDLTPLQTLITRQNNLRSVSAEFTQIRTLSSLRTSLTSKGRVWFQFPTCFRWELGNPPKTLVIGTPNGLTVIQPAKKQAVMKSLSSSDAFSVVGSFGLMHLPGNGSLEEFQKHVQVLGIGISGSTCHLEMRPREVEAVSGLDLIRLDFNTLTGEWISLEIVARDGSLIRNEFANVVINPVLKKGLFDYDLSGFKVTDEKN